MFTDIQQRQITDIIEGTKVYINFIQSLISSGNWDKLSKKRKFEYKDALANSIQDITRLAIMLEDDAKNG